MLSKFVKNDMHYLRFLSTFQRGFFTYWCSVIKIYIKSSLWPISMCYQMLFIKKKSLFQYIYKLLNSINWQRQHLLVANWLTDSLDVHFVNFQNVLGQRTYICSEGDETYTKFETCKYMYKLYVFHKDWILWTKCSCILPVQK